MKATLALRNISPAWDTVSSLLRAFGVSEQVKSAFVDSKWPVFGQFQPGLGATISFF
jgi:hypothetical protein